MSKGHISTWMINLWDDWIKSSFPQFINVKLFVESNLESFLLDDTHHVIELPTLERNYIPRTWALRRNILFSALSLSDLLGYGITVLSFVAVGGCLRAPSAQWAPISGAIATRDIRQWVQHLWFLVQTPGQTGNFVTHPADRIHGGLYNCKEGLKGGDMESNSKHEDIGNTRYFFSDNTLMNY